MNKLYLFIIIMLLQVNLFSQQKKSEKLLIVRFDDIGMCHSVNMAAEKVADLGIPVSFSIMFTCPWYQEAVDIIKDKPNVTAGIHLVLNAEWKNYRWGPVAGKDAVPSLVDSAGFFFPSRASLYKNNPTLPDIEKELRSQIERALHSGLKISYVDYHMGTAVDKPEYRKIVEKLAEEYHLGISRYFGDTDIPIMYAVPIPEKADSLYKTLSEIKPGINLLVCHVGLDNPEMQAMIDLNSFGLKHMSKHRNAELNALLSPKFKEEIKKNNIKLINYAELIDKVGLENMKRPTETGY